MRVALITAISASVVSLAALSAHGAASAKSHSVHAAKSLSAAAAPIGSQALGALLHATPDRVRSRLGEPSIARAEGRGALWTYERSECALFIFFRDEGGLRVSGAAAGQRHRGVPAPDLDVCLNQLQRSDLAGRTP